MENAKTKRYRCTKCGEVYGYAYSTCPGCGAKCSAVGGNDATVQEVRDGSTENGLTSSERFFLNGVRQLLSKGVLTDADRASLDWLAMDLGISDSRRDILIGQAGCEPETASVSDEGIARSPSPEIVIPVPPNTKYIRLHGWEYMDFIWCPPGSFMRDGHLVILTKGFWLGKYPVTVEQWRAVMGGNISNTRSRIYHVPVEGVSWDACRRFIAKVNSAQKSSMRLPTEAEWEYACRAGTIGSYSGTGNLDEMGWYSGNSGETIHPVGKKLPNHWGFYDMHGNVREWCADRYDIYPERDVIDPVGELRGRYHVIRGGCFIESAYFCRSEYRSSGIAYDAAYHTGFRVALDE